MWNRRILYHGKSGLLNIKAMTKEEYLSIAAARYDELQSLNELDNFYDYEKKFVGILQDMGRAILEKNLSELPYDRRKKKPHDSRICDNKQATSIL